MQNNAQSGVVAIFGSVVTMTASNLVNNGATGDPALGRNGLAISDNSAATILSSTVSGNASSGIFVGRSSNARIGLSSTAVAGPNTIVDNGGSGISVCQRSQALIHGNQIGAPNQGNDSSGVSVEGSSATVTSNIIEHNGEYGVSVGNSGGAQFSSTPATTRTPDTLVNGFNSCN